MAVKQGEMRNGEVASNLPVKGEEEKMGTGKYIKKGKEA